METEWAEKRADIPQGGIRKYLAKALDMLYSSPTRNKFRVRLERGNVADTTELYLTHRGAEEVARGKSFIWENRPSNPELEAEMLNSLMIFLGVEKKQAETLLAEKPISRAQLMRSKEDQVYLVINEDFARTWRNTGLALDRLGFTVEDRDRSRGLYFIRYIDPEPEKEKGFFASLFSRKSTSDNQAYRINLREDSSTIRIVVLDDEGNISPSKTAERILTLLHEQLK
jgi:outer membrane protein assembly factor BamC